MSMRILHTMLRVGDLDRSIDFYTRVLGMRLLRKTDRPEQQLHARVRRLWRRSATARCSSSRTTMASIATTSAPPTATSRSRFADAAATCDAVRSASDCGGAVTREAGPVKGGTTVIAFVQDPDGYKIELIERR